MQIYLLKSGFLLRDVRNAHQPQTKAAKLRKVCAADGLWRAWLNVNEAIQWRKLWEAAKSLPITLRQPKSML